MRELLRLEKLPVYQNKMFGTAIAAQACPRGDILLVQDEVTGLVCNTLFDPDRLTYDESYQNEQACSSSFQGHLKSVLKIIDRHLRTARILEIGCGKGTFLDLMRREGYDAWGVDPAYEGDKPYIVKTTFGPGPDVHSNAIVIRHVLEHIPQPLTFLEQIRRTTSADCRIYIEVPCLDWILRNRAWFDICYEHVNYFRLADFGRIFSRVLESGHLFGGQYLYVVAELASLRDQEHFDAAERVDIPENFFASIEQHIADSALAPQRIIWGAGAKGVMFSSHMVTRGMALDFAIDINPAKQGKFLAASGLQVLSPQIGLAQLACGADIFVMNSQNYLSEIQAMAGPDFRYLSMDKT